MTLRAPIGAVVLSLGAFSATGAMADPMLADFAYPYEVQRFSFQSQGHTLEMAYMDIQPAKPNGKAVLLLHGKNFCGATWEGTIAPLSAAGYRVVVPDQIGFCKSSKPLSYSMRFHEFASNSRALVTSLGIEKPILVGHSMGGMLTIRYALSFAADVRGIVLVNPIGLEDWRAKGVPDRTLDQLFEAEKSTDAARIKAYQLKAYYDGEWRPAYDKWVEMLASMYAGEGRETVAWAQAMSSQMIFTDQVVHEFERISVPAALLIGEKDTTAIGRDRLPPESARGLGDYPTLSREAAKRITGAKLVTFPELWHSPQVQDAARFNAALLEALAAM